MELAIETARKGRDVTHNALNATTITAQGVFCKVAIGEWKYTRVMPLKRIFHHNEYFTMHVFVLKITSPKTLNAPH